jgi:hypothetical protein
MVKTFFGYSHTAIQRTLAECHQEPFASDEEVLTFTIGGSRPYFVNGRKYSTDVSDIAQHVFQVGEICEDYRLHVRSYLERFADIEGILREFRNPDDLTRKLILSVITQSYIILIAAYLTQDLSYFRTILEQEKIGF